MQQFLSRVFRRSNSAIYASMAVFILVIAVVYIWSNQSPVDTPPEVGGRPSTTTTASSDSSTEISKPGLGTVSENSGLSLASSPSTSEPASTPRSVVSKVVETRNAMVLDDLAKLKQTVSEVSEKWQSTLERMRALMESDQGQQVAKEQALVEKFISLQSLAQKTNQQLETAKRTAAVTQIELDEFIAAQSNQAIPTSISGQIAKQLEQFEQLGQEVAARESGLSAIVSEASGLPTGDKTLRSAIAELKSKQEGERLALESKARQDSRQQQKQELAKLQADLAAKEAELEKKQIESKIEQVDSQIASEKNDQRLAADVPS
jgi:hypothetical protein